ncbi:MAG TPA: response regulator [Bryobacteraceae bacterium]|jgi:signal transduction histidine kinase
MERTGFEQWKPREVARLLALVEAERRYYQEMMAVLPAALVVLAQDRTILSANMAFRRLAGLSGEELRKRKIEQILPSDELIECLRAAHVHGDTAAFFINLPFEIPIGLRSFRMAAVPIRGWEDDMEPETLVLIQELEGQAPPEIPPSKVVEPLEPAPEPAPAPASVIDFDTLPAAVWQADASTFVFTYAGGAAQSILGYAPEQWLAEPQFFSERIHPDDRAEVMDLYRSVAATGGEASAEYRALTASGAPSWCRETIRVPAPGAGVRHIAGVMTAIGERRQLEAQSFAAARIDALRALSSRLAHDLNNPLMILAGYGEELLNALSFADPLREDLTEVVAASSRLSELAGHLLSFARSQAKAPAKIQLGDVIATVAPKLGAGIDLDIVSSRDAVWTFADPEQLEEAISALAAFAIENTSGVLRLNLICHTGRIAERVGHATLKPGVYARLDIQAVGVGIGAAASGVFESILPNKDLNKPAGPAIARAYLNVRQWGGDIAFSSSGQGSMFAVYLPYAESPAEAVPETPAAAAPPEPPPAPVPEPPPPVEAPLVEPSLGTVLVVEDEPGIRGLVRKILKRERFDVIEAGRAEEALQTASPHGAPIGLLLTDVMLPGMGGRELAEMYKAAQPNLKVVYISGFTDDESVRAGEFPPGSMFLQKPFTLSALVGIVKQAFEL